MANQINDATYRALLHTDLMAAHSGAHAVLAIYDSVPRLPTDPNPPYYVLHLLRASQQGAGLRKIAQTLEYEITYVGLLSAITGTIQAAKLARLNEAMSVITAGRTYGTYGSDYLISEATFEDSPVMEGESTYEVAFLLRITNIDERSTA
jgi:hypothetical protein